MNIVHELGSSHFKCETKFCHNKGCMQKIALEVYERILNGRSKVKWAIWNRLKVWETIKQFRKGPSICSIRCHVPSFQSELKSATFHCPLWCFVIMHVLINANLGNGYSGKQFCIFYFLALIIFGIFIRQMVLVKYCLRKLMVVSDERLCKSKFHWLCGLQMANR